MHRRAQRASAWWSNWALALLITAGLAARLPRLGAPLLEGAAGKQTHTAMVARNFYRGRSSWLRPMVDDVGRPGYFVKELPLFPAAAALLYRLNGGVDERLGRLLSIAAWLSATPFLVALCRHARGPRVGWFAGLWYVLAPLGIAYSRAFMSDAAMVAASIAALASFARWRRQPGATWALASSATLALALLLKPHAAFWLVPGILALLAWQEKDAPRATVRRGEWLVLSGLVGAAFGLAAIWYLHAAAVHRQYPVLGATVLTGWVDLSLLGRSSLYAIVGRQELGMVFTPLGALLAVLGFALLPSRLEPEERALLAWGAGVICQCLVFATRMFDERARGTEYYQLAMVPVAALLVARGLEVVAQRAAGWSRVARALAVPILLVALSDGAARATVGALEIPPGYAALADDCSRVQALTRPDETILVIADRPGVVLYYCDRRGFTFIPAKLATGVAAPAVAGVTSEALSQALSSSDHVLYPFADMLAATPQLAAHLESEWRELPTGSPQMRLFARVPPGAGSGGRP